jgi:anti-sigma-K factor RskA
LDKDDMWADALLKELPSAPVSPRLERRILADFDRLAARPRVLDRLREMLWPGASLWRPAGALAAALVIGVIAGSYVPLEDNAEMTATVALDELPSFDLGEAS